MVKWIDNPLCLCYFLTYYSIFLMGAITISAKSLSNTGNISTIHHNHTYKLRAHHGLCLFYFNGKGYSDEFVKNMFDVKYLLDKNPLVYITSKTDIICGKCPNNMNNRCKGEDKVTGYDRRVLSRCNLSDGDILPYHSFRDLIYHNIILPGKREEVCGNCSWTKLCSYPLDITFKSLP